MCADHQDGGGEAGPLQARQHEAVPQVRHQVPPRLPTGAAVEQEAEDDVQGTPTQHHIVSGEGPESHKWILESLNSPRPSCLWCAGNACGTPLGLYGTQHLEINKISEFGVLKYGRGLLASQLLCVVLQTVKTTWNYRDACDDG